MIQVIIRKGESLEKALRRFKKKYEKAGILREIRKKSYYMKPSVEKKMKKVKVKKFY